MFAGSLAGPPVAALLILLWAHRSRTPWREIGYVRPAHWVLEAAAGILGGGAFKFLMKAIVMPLLGADPVNHAYHSLAGNPVAVLSLMPAVTIGAGFGEETFFRGYLFERLGRMLGPGAGARVAIVLLTSVFFGAVHYPVQGWAGAGQAAIVGLVFGTIFTFTGRLWPLMWAHAAFDVTAVALIYWNLEAKIAHLVFR